MTVKISIGSGKGGVGKSTILTNLAILLAKTGKTVCIADLDIGGPDVHTLYGIFDPKLTLTDFLSKKTNDINGIARTIDLHPGVSILPGTGDTLQTANMTYQEKQRLFSGLSKIDAEILLLDVGAGTSYHVLDFFMYSDIQICAALPEPAAIMDFYNFLQLATIRKALSSFMSHSEVSNSLKRNKFSSLKEVLDLAEATEAGARIKAQEALKYFNPLLITNKISKNSRLNQMKLQSMTSKYLGISLPNLGEIPDDSAVIEAAKNFMPICEYNPASQAARAFGQIAEKLSKVLELFMKKQD